MIKTFLSTSAIAASLMVMTPASFAQTTPLDPAAISAEIAQLDTEIEAAEINAAQYSGGALGVLSTYHLETLRLTRALLEARQTAEETRAPIEIVAPATEPDPAKVADIEAEIAAQEQRVEVARREAAGAGGLMAALSQTRLQTERVTLAQLRQGLLQARFGLALPTIAGSAATPPPNAAAPEDAGAKIEAPDDEVAASTPGLAWADPDHPEIDYSASIFRSLDQQDFEITGWWGLQRTTAEIDDSPLIFAMNVSDWGGDFGDHPSLKAACIEGESRIIYDVDDYLLTDYQSTSLPVIVRIDDEDAQTQNWSTLTNNSGVGLFGARAEDFIRDIRDSEKLFLRTRERNGVRHDLSIDLAGSEPVWQAVAEACGFSLLDLGREDYRAIQELLNAGGFDSGRPDGVWGGGSQRAMRSFQEANDLPASGVPDIGTLRAMGLDADF